MQGEMKVLELAAGEGKRPALVLGRRAIPALGPGELLVEVAAAGVNRADLAQRAGGYAPPPGASDLLGLEVSGRVVEVGPGVSDAVPDGLFAPGQEVCALLAGGGYAGYVAVDHRHALPVPQGMDLVTAAGLMEVFATAWGNIFLEAAARPGERVLVHAGGSGVGTAAIQLCAMQGNPCFATAGGEAKLQAARELGAEGAAPRGEAMFDAVREWAPKGVDVVLDPVAAGYLAGNLDCLALDGRLVLIGLLSGAGAEISLATVLVKRLRLIGSTLRNRSGDYKAALVAQMHQKLWPAFAAGQLRVVLDRTFPMEDAEEAHRHMAADANLGKILLTMS